MDEFHKHIRELPEIVVDDSRLGREAQDVTDGFVGVVEQILRFPDGEERIQLGRDGYSRCDLDVKQVTFIEGL